MPVRESHTRMSLDKVKTDILKTPILTMTQGSESILNRPKKSVPPIQRKHEVNWEKMPKFHYFSKL